MPGEGDDMDFSRDDEVNPCCTDGDEILNSGRDAHDNSCIVDTSSGICDVDETPERKRIQQEVSNMRNNIMDNPLRRSLKNSTSGGVDINQIQFDLRKSGNFNKIGGEEGEENQMNYS